MGAGKIAQPWEKYQTQTPEESGPWEKYQGSAGERSQVLVETPKAQQELTKKDAVGQSRFGGVLGLSEPPTRRQRIESYGLGGKEGGGTVSRLAASAGNMEDVKSALSQQFSVSPEEIDVGNIEGIGLVFRNPETGDYEPLDPEGLQLGDVSQALAEAPILALEAAGGVVGSRLGVPGAIGGAASGAALGRGLVSSGLKAAGVVEKEPEEIAKEALTEGSISAIGGAIPVAGRAARYAVSPERRAIDRLSKNIVGKQGLTTELLEEAEKAAAPLSETGAQLTTGQKVGLVEPEIGARLRSTELFAPGQGAAIEAEKSKSRRLAREGLQAEVSPRTDVDTEVSGRQIIEAAEQSYERQLENISNATVNEINNINQELAKFSGAGLLEGGASIRNTLQSGRDKVFNTISNQYDELWSQVPSDTKVDLAGLRKTANKWKNRLDQDFFKSLIPEDRNIINEALELGLEKADGKVVDVGGSLSAATRALSLLKSEKRLLQKSPKDASLKQIKLIDDFIKDIEKSRADALESLDPALAQKIRETDAAWAQAKSAIDESLVGDILRRKKAGDYKISDDKVLSKAISSPADLHDYLRSTSDYPEVNAVYDLKRALDGDYADKVINGQQSHFTWMNRNREVIEQLYSKPEMKRFENSNRLKSAIKLSEKNEARLVSDLKNKFDYELTRYDPESVFEATKGKPSRARQLRYLLESHPEKWENYKDVRRKKIVDDLSQGKSLDQMLLGDSRKELNIVLGEQYVDDLSTLNKLINIEKAKPGKSLTRPVSEDPDSVFQLARNQIFGQLDPTSFRARTIGRFSRAATDRAMERLLFDPDLLHKAIKLRNTSRNSAPVQSLLASLGLTAYIDAPSNNSESEKP